MSTDFGNERRRHPRYPIQQPVEGATQGALDVFWGVVRDISGEGCGLFLDTHVPPGTPVEVRCNINGIALRLRGQVVWSKPKAEGISEGALHGIHLTGFASEEDALFHRVYLARLSRRAASSPSRQRQ